MGAAPVEWGLCSCLLIRREAGPQLHIQKLASNCSENSEIGFLLCCVADPHGSRQLEKLNSCYQPGLYWTSAGQVFGLGCGALNITLPSCVWRWNELVNERLSICSASGRCFAKVQVPWGGLATWSSFHDVLTKGTPTFSFYWRGWTNARLLFSQMHRVPGRSVSLMYFCNLMITFLIISI